MDMTGLKEGELRMGSNGWIGAILLHFISQSQAGFITWQLFACYMAVFFIEGMGPGLFLFVLPAIFTVLGTFNKCLLSK